LGSFPAGFLWSRVIYLMTSGWNLSAWYFDFSSHVAAKYVAIISNLQISKRRLSEHLMLAHRLAVINSKKSLQ
jgi:hypothetical protein